MDRKASRNQRKHLKTKNNNNNKKKTVFRESEDSLKRPIKFVTLWETALNLKKETKPISMRITFLGGVYSDVHY